MMSELETNVSGIDHASVSEGRCGSPGSAHEDLDKSHTSRSDNKDENHGGDESDESDFGSDDSNVTDDDDEVSAGEVESEPNNGTLKLRRSKRTTFGNRYEEALKTDKDEARIITKRNALLDAANVLQEEAQSSSEDDDMDFRPEDHPKKSDSPSSDKSDSESGSDSSEEDGNEDSKAASNRSGEQPIAPKVPKKKDPLYSAFDQKKSLDELLDEVAQSERLDGFKICSICLWDECDPEADAVIQCDSCGCSVHEACYGVVGKELEELHTKDSDTQSSTETMPWFCDPCRFGERDPLCVMCPNKFGAFKQTVKGEWVHSACARYTKEVYFDDDVKLTDVVLSDVPYQRWGDHPCVVCDDIYGKHAGITIKCETGMCRKFLHVTCAMLVGSAVEMEPEMGYPLAIYCADHTPKDDRAGNRRCFLAALGLQRRHQIALKKIDHLERDRLDAAEEVQRKAYLEQRKSRELESGIGTSVRPLHAAYSLISKGHARSEALGMDAKPTVNPNPTVETARLNRPDFRPEFVAYVYRREAMIVDYISRMEKSKAEREFAMQIDPTRGKALWKSIVPHWRAEKDSLSKLLSPFIRYTDHKPEKKAEVNNSRKRNKFEDLLRKTDNGNRTQLEAKCATCGSGSFPQRMAQCDDCRKWFHLKCLDPPLTSMPNRRGVKWLCSTCVPTSSSDEEHSETDPSEGRRRRRLQGQNPTREKQNTIGVPTPLPPGQKKRGRKPGFRPEKKIKMESEQIASTSMTTGNETKSMEGTNGGSSTHRRRGRKRRSEDGGSGTCVVCHKVGNGSDAVECTMCHDWYHFVSCLNPPCSRSPRSRFYGWLCEKCTEIQDGQEIDEPDWDK